MQFVLKRRLNVLKVLVDFVLAGFVLVKGAMGFFHVSGDV